MKDVNPLFDQVKVITPPRNTFDLSHTNIMTGEAGYMIPCFVDEFYPGDKVDIDTSVLCRTEPLTAPIYQNIDIMTHYFKVPLRLLMSHRAYQNFMSGGRRGDIEVIAPGFKYADIIDAYNKTYTTSAVANWFDRNFKVGSLSDYLGYPVEMTFTDPSVDDNQYVYRGSSRNVLLSKTSKTAQIQLNSFALRAYQLIWQEYYRDENVTDELYDFREFDPYPVRDPQLPVNDNIPDWFSLFHIRKACWRKDMFTSALPFAQRGLVGQYAIDAILENDDTATTRVINQGSTGSSVSSGIPIDWATDSSSASHDGYLVDEGSSDRQDGLNIDVTGQLSVSGNINMRELRAVEASQKWLEASARGGYRYIEQVKAHWGVDSSDKLFDRPEYLGGGIQGLNVSEVVQTSESTQDSPQGNMAGHAYSAGNNNHINTFCEEHCVIVGILTIRPRAAYFQGIPLRLTRINRFDFPFPEFARIGEQAIKNYQLWFDMSEDRDEESWTDIDGVRHEYSPTGDFGYTPRYAELKDHSDEIHGEFRTTLNYWHQARILSNSDVRLNKAFMECSPSKRIFAVENNDSHYYISCYHNYYVSRLLPYFGTPMLT